MDSQVCSKQSLELGEKKRLKALKSLNRHEIIHNLSVINHIMLYLNITFFVICGQ